jgi:heme exporter protein A
LGDSRAIDTAREIMSGRSLQAENLHLWRADRHVLKGLRFSLAEGECLQVRGSNGAGKTSLLRTLSGLIYPEDGKVSWDGEDIRRDLHTFQAELAYIGHEPPLKSDLTARENLHYWIGMRCRVSRPQMDAALDRVGARDWQDRPIRTLSAGQKRRVALAGLALMAVPLWLLDEPTTNLDAQGQALVATLIEEQLGRGGLVVAAIHHELPIAAGRVRQLELPSS